MNEPFTRYADNEAMNEHLKEQLHVGEDPMADYMSKKKHKVEMKTGVGKWPNIHFKVGEKSANRSASRVNVSF